MLTYETRRNKSFANPCKRNERNHTMLQQIFNFFRHCFARKDYEKEEEAGPLQRTQTSFKAQLSQEKLIGNLNTLYPPKKLPQYWQRFLRMLK